MTGTPGSASEDSTTVPPLVQSDSFPSVPLNQHEPQVVDAPHHPESMYEKHPDALDFDQQPPTTSIAEVSPATQSGFFAKFFRRRGQRQPGDGDTSLEVVDAPEKVQDAVPPVPFFSLFRFAQPLDYLLIAVGLICSIGTGVSQPLMTIVFGDMLQSFTDYAFYARTDLDKANLLLDDSINEMLKWFGVLCGATFVAGFFQIFCFSYAAERQCRRVRELYYASILRQEISWFDTVSSGELTSRISGDVNILQEGISSKLGIFIQYVVCFITGFVIAFAKGWRLALVLLAVFPLMAICGSLMAKFVSEDSSAGQSSYASAGAVAEEVISGIRTVMAFGAQEREVGRYEKNVNVALKAGLRKAFVSGLGLGIMMMLIYLTYALGFWYGVKLTSEKLMDGGDVLIVFFALIIGAMSLGQAAPNITSVANAQGAAAKVFQLIEKERLIDPLASEGRILDNLQGRIEFHHLKFHYPTRPDVPILKKFDLTVEAGETVALVGASGSGKSTIVSLLERFYDPVEGDIFLDGVDIRDLNVRFLRSHIGIVSQEPVLFGTTVRQNILWGVLDDRDAKVTDAELEQACRDANAYDFISKLPNGLDSLVGEKGSLLSGGQKQRIAIARAIIRNPRILLLDEATSALDSKSERLVQDALDRASQNRTTIVIAHRLSTIRDADKIVVMNKGEIVEVGTHNSLLAKDGAYAQLVRSQALKKRDPASFSPGDFYSEGMPSQLEVEESMSEELSTMDPVSKTPSYTSLSATDLGPQSPAKSKDADFSEKSPQLDGGATLTVPKRKEKGKSHRRWRRKSKKEKTEADEAEDESEEALWEAQKERLQVEPMPFKRLAVMNLPEKWYVIVGSILALIDGAIMPSFAIVFAKLLTVFSELDNPGKMRKDVGLLETSGERLTKRVRLMSFRAIIYQDAAFFDDRANGTGILCSKLATESERVKNLSGKLIGTILNATSSLVVGVVIALIRGWQLTLVVLALLPVIIAGTALEMKAMAGFDSKIKKAYDQTAQSATETVTNLRTVAMLNREHTFINAFQASNDQPHRAAIRAFVVDSIGSAFSQAQMFLIMIIAFYYGSRLVIWQTYNIEEMFQVIYALVFSAMGVSMAAQQLGDISKAKVAALSIFEIVDRSPSVDTGIVDGKTVSAVDGFVDTHEVDFSYPTASHIPILNKVNVTAQPGQTVALVGNSGSGKSTVIALVQRLYDVLGGSISVDKTDVREWQLQNLRSNLSIVGQEPVLFDMTIRENICYGKPDATDEEIEKAARSANIHEFIQSLPQQYQTSVGERGGQLSGGQKQRIAIARALIRNPKVLLLDEATSALDSQSERLVQDTLDKVRKGRTTLTIAHRLSTIQDADMIVVFENGQVVERGTHFELVDQRGVYYSLVKEQSLDATH
ncbi:hypothetical protein IWQ61_006717 [Dispira simplex]|nr:hypothetical protein IWQ61_006717 [Dispira simplex]